ncbi:phospholipase D family protein [Limnohabitans curvus]|nr:phospholipase D family protein [Limnohabitans curvus]
MNLEFFRHQWFNNEKGQQVSMSIHKFLVVLMLFCGFVSLPTTGTAGQAVRAAGSLEVAFSPAGGGEELVIKVIDSARSEIKVLAYSFTSAPIVRALLAAHKRGVAVSIVADEKSNLSEGGGNQKALAALSALANAGVDVRTSNAYAASHDKVLCVDRVHVETGSFNFSASAETRNSENVLVNWNNPDLAAVYLKHFERNYKQSRSFTPR